MVCIGAAATVPPTFRIIDRLDGLNIVHSFSRNGIGLSYTEKALQCALLLLVLMLLVIGRLNLLSVDDNFRVVEGSN